MRVGISLEPIPLLEQNELLKNIIVDGLLRPVFRPCAPWLPAVGIPSRHKARIVYQPKGLLLPECLQLRAPNVCFLISFAHQRRFYTGGPFVISLMRRAAVNCRVHLRLR